MLQGTTAVMASIAAPADPSIAIFRDLQYGPDARNRLDVFRSVTPASAPVLVYVHGGGFVMGDKTREGSPFYDNFGQWAAQQGWLGVTLTYRLAPQHRWPSGPEDMARAVSWLRAHVAGYGGDPDQIILVGQSAGATHVASYIGLPRFHAGGPAGISGAVLISGIYDSLAQPPDPFNSAYFGEGPEARREAQSIDGLLATSVPLLFTISENDPRDFHDQAAQLAHAWHQKKGRCPPLEYLRGHNHLSPAQSLGSAEDQLAGCIADFVGTRSARNVRPASA
jgi:triacylglycerol lipase